MDLVKVFTGVVPAKCYRIDIHSTLCLSTANCFFIIFFKLCILNKSGCKNQIHS